MGVVVCLQVNRSAVLIYKKSIPTDHDMDSGLYNPFPVCVDILRRCSNLPSRYDINPQVPSIFIDHIPETGRISMTFAQQFHDRLMQLRPTTTNFIPSADVNR